MTTPIQWACWVCLAPPPTTPTTSPPRLQDPPSTPLNTIIIISITSLITIITIIIIKSLPSPSAPALFRIWPTCRVSLTRWPIILWVCVWFFSILFLECTLEIWPNVFMKKWYLVKHELEKLSLGNGVQRYLLPILRRYYSFESTWPLLPSSGPVTLVCDCEPRR